MMRLEDSRVWNKKPKVYHPQGGTPKQRFPPEPKRRDGDREAGSLGPSARSDLEQREHPGSAPSTRRRDPEHPDWWRGRPGKDAYPLPSFRSYSESSDYSDSSGSSSLQGPQPPLLQISSPRTQSPGPVFKARCGRRRRLHSRKAKLQPPHSARAPPLFPAVSWGPGPASVAGRDRPRPWPSLGESTLARSAAPPLPRDAQSGAACAPGPLLAVGLGLGPRCVTAAVRGFGLTVRPHFTPCTLFLGNGPR